MIESYNFGEIIIDGTRYTNDLIIFTDRILDNWWRKEGHKVHLEDLKDVLPQKPEIIIIGTGDSGLVKIPSETKKYLESQGIKLIAQPTKKACQNYNKLKNTQKIIAAFHLTC
ncbi:MAG: MTH938/NDUFAF3 family protein [Thermodesulfobacteriota bacterium]|nr:MTH938/NDUFAF3 family protein [Thermodesulfobacteriota bacterium]